MNRLAIGISMAICIGIVRVAVLHPHWDLIDYFYAVVCCITVAFLLGWREGEGKRR